MTLHYASEVPIPRVMAWLGWRTGWVRWGSLSVQSPAGGGTVVTATLPLPLPAA